MNCGPLRSECPPSILMHWPVIHRESELIRNLTKEATSSDWPTSPKGVLSM